MCDKHLHINASFRTDPTRTTTLRKRFEGEFYRRFRRLKGEIRREVVELDGFGLKNNRGRFDSGRSEAKIASFMEWLGRVQAREIIGFDSAEERLSRAARRTWTATYVEQAYRSGIRQAGSKLRSAGAEVSDRWVDAAFDRPIHADRVGLAYIRTFEELEGVTAAMDQQISRELARGIAEGRNPIDIAKSLNDRVDKIGITRARVIARTEVISAHAEASINTYEEAGVEGVEVEAEWLTAADACQLCVDASEQGPYTLDEARGMIPLHPNCKCSFAPRVVNGTGIELR